MTDLRNLEMKKKSSVYAILGVLIFLLAVVTGILCFRFVSETMKLPEIDIWGIMDENGNAVIKYTVNGVTKYQKPSIFDETKCEYVASGYYSLEKDYLYTAQNVAANTGICLFGCPVLLIISAILLLAYFVNLKHYNHVGQGEKVYADLKDAVPAFHGIRLGVEYEGRMYYSYKVTGEYYPFQEEIHKNKYQVGLYKEGRHFFVDYKDVKKINSIEQ